jgi:hypothetical protein
LSGKEDILANVTLQSREETWVMSMGGGWNWFMIVSTKYLYFEGV